MNLAPTLLLTTCVPLFLIGCKVGPDYETPVTPTPDGWVASAESKAAVRVELDTSADVDLSRWWSRLGDPRLAFLVGREIQENL